MRYATAAAFRAAVETRLNRLAAERPDASVMRLRKVVVFDRLLARLQVVAPDRWIVKGGAALEFRLPSTARTTKDLDLVGLGGDVAAHLVAAQATDPGDFFMFTIERDPGAHDPPAGVAMGYHVRADLAGRRFEEVTVDIGYGDGLPIAPDRLLTSGLLAFAGIEPIEVLALPLTRHIAEKVHAYTRTYERGQPSSRVKDLVDLVLICTTFPIESAASLRTELNGVFAVRATHSVPPRFPVPPADWSVPYRRLTRGTGLSPDLLAGYRLAAAFLDPVLSGEAVDSATWNAASGRWFDRPKPSPNDPTGSTIK